jgi:ribonuclease T1
MAAAVPSMASISLSASRFALAGLLLALLATGADARDTRGTMPQQPSQASIALGELPAQGQRTYQAILNGGPFKHDKDGTVFGNRERLLPSERRGHYREYTVDTPRARNRGARRIVCGGQPATAPTACWYTADHYASFRRIAP